MAKKKEYVVHVVSKVITYMSVEATTEEEAKEKAYEDMPTEFGIDSFDSELDTILEVVATKAE